MQGSVRVHTFSSAACVHAVESSDDGSHPSHRSAEMQNGKTVSSKEVKRRVKKLLSPLKQKWRIIRAFRPGSKAANTEAMNDAGDQSDAKTFVSANDSELRSFRTDDDSESELPSFRLSPLIFPVGTVERPLTGSPVKIVHKLPFGYVIGRPLDAPAPPSMTLVRNFKKMMPMLPDLQLRSRSRVIKKKVVRALKERFGRGSRRGRDGRAGEGDDCGDNGDGDGDGDGDDEGVFWKKDLRGLRCRPVEDDEPPY